MPFPGNEVGHSFHAGIEQLRYPYKACHPCQRNGFETGNFQDVCGGDDRDGRHQVDTGVVLPANKLPEAGDGIGEAFYSAADRKSLWFHDL